MPIIFQINLCFIVMQTFILILMNYELLFPVVTASANKNTTPSRLTWLFLSGSLNWQLADSNWLVVELLIVGPISNISTGSSAASASASSASSASSAHHRHIIGTSSASSAIGNRQSAIGIGNRHRQSASAIGSIVIVIL